MISPKGAVQIMTSKKKDYILAAFAGLIAGVIAWKILLYLDFPSLYEISFAWLIFYLPFIMMAAVWMGYRLGRYASFFNELGKFSTIGFMNATVDYGILYLLIHIFNKPAGLYYVLFKSISITLAIINSYVWNKYWVFVDKIKPVTLKEIYKFFKVYVYAIIANIIVSAAVVYLLNHLTGINPRIIAGIGAIIGSIASLVFTFANLRKSVFVSD